MLSYANLALSYAKYVVNNNWLSRDYDRVNVLVKESMSSMIH
jgi:hypothetical protein